MAAKRGALKSPSNSSSPAAPSSSKPATGGSSPTKRRRVVVFDDSSSDDDDLVVVGSGTKKRQTKLTLEPIVRGKREEEAPAVAKKQAETEAESESERSSSPDLPTSSRKQTPRRRAIVDDEDEDDEDEDDAPLVTPTSSNRIGRRPKRARPADSHDEDADEDDLPQPVSSPTKRRRLIRRPQTSSPGPGGGGGGGGDGGDVMLVSSSQQLPPSSATRRRFRNEKERARELLRRKRAGEAIEELTEDDEDEENDEPKKAIYDTDSDNPALSDFEDDEEDEAKKDAEGSGSEAPPTSSKPSSKKDRKKKKKRKNRKSTGRSDDDSSDSDPKLSDANSASDIDDFVVDDDEDAPLGVPHEALLDIPLEFTAHSHKPLKEHFRDVVEWLVLTKTNPGFAERRHELYTLAWKKLDDEVRGLAQSKFASSAWKKDFYMALRARPYYTNSELPPGDRMLGDLQSCGACGRSGHPATWVITFHGAAYYKNSNADGFLEDVEGGGGSDSDESSSSSSSDDSSSDEEPTTAANRKKKKQEKTQEKNDQDPEDNYDVDEDGNPIPPASRKWYIGSVCNANAETAHTLIHWKHALLDWVDSTLARDGYMTPQALKKRADMKPKKRYKQVDKILEKWVSQGVIKNLFRDFKQTVEDAKNRDTSGRRGGGRR